MKFLIFAGILSQIIFPAAILAADTLFQLQTKPDQTIVQPYSGRADETSAVIPLNNFPKVSGFGINGTLSLIHDTSFVRIILVDTLFNEYLIYETDTLLSPDKTIVLENTCEETESLENVRPSFIRIESGMTVIGITSFSIVLAKSKTVSRSKKTSLNTDRRKDKITRINQQLRKAKKQWVAGDTSVSKLSYAEKKALLGGNLPNLHGFDYYVGGVFEIPSAEDPTGEKPLTSPTMPKASTYVDEFTWQNRHGQNWITPVKSQGGCGSCWAFASTGSTELLVNLYYNQHLDLNLSEQDALSCSGAGDCSGGFPGTVLDYYTNTGVVEEACFPYSQHDENDGVFCSDKCSNPTETIIIGGKTTFNRESEDTLKQFVINGPVSFGVGSWEHAVGLVGYKTLKQGDTFYIYTPDYSGTQTISAGDPLIGKTAWIIKNSWGDWWGADGFAHVVTELSNISWTHAIHGPVQSLNHTDNDIACVDSDNDGYYAWGIGSKPASCPPSPAEPDGDDSDETMGPIDEFGHLTPITDTVSISYPANNAFITDGANITIEASAIAVTSTVIGVDFFEGNQLLGEDFTLPYSFEWVNVPEGSHEIRAVASLASGKLVEAPPVFFTVTGPLGEGSISRFVWSDIPGSAINDLTGNGSYPDTPSLSETISLFETPGSFADNYGTRVIGYLHPPVSGNYTFAVSGDDNCELWLGQDDTDADRVLIASVPGWSNAREWDKYPEQTSIEIPLAHGNRYYIEALHKEGGGGDHLAVGWTIPGNEFNVIDGLFLSPMENKPPVYTVTFQAESNGMIFGESIQTISEGENCQPVTAVPDSGYRFTSWTGDYDGTEATITLTNISKNMTITAHFSKKVYTVNFIAGSGGSINGITTQAVTHGDNCSTVIAIPDSNARFTGWQGDFTYAGENLSIQNVISDMTITANFTLKTYTVTFLAGNGGTLSGETRQTITHGEASSEVTAIADTGQHFTGWTGDFSGTLTQLSVPEVISDMTLTAEFSVNIYAVNFSASTGGAIQGESIQSVPHGEQFSPIMAIPNEGYHFTGWSGSISGDSPILNPAEVTENITATALFEINTYHLLFAAGENGHLEGFSSQTLTHGESSQAITAVPDEHYDFKGWEGDFSGTSETLTLENITSDMTIDAVFIKQKGIANEAQEETACFISNLQ